MAAFQYINFLDRPYDNVNKTIRSILFCTDRYWQTFKVIKFDDLVTEKFAIQTVETYLSEPATEEYYNAIMKMAGGDERKNEFKSKGDFLEEAKWLCSISVDTEGAAKTECIC